MPSSLPPPPPPPPEANSFRGPTRREPMKICMGWYMRMGRQNHTRSGLPSNIALMRGRPNAMVFCEPMYTAATLSRFEKAGMSLVVRRMVAL